MDRNPWARTKRESMCDGWASLCDFENVLDVWDSLYSPERLAVNEPVLGGLSEFVAPIVYLADRGTSAALAAEIETLCAAAEILRRHGPGPLHDPDRLEETAKRVESEIPRLERMRHCAAKAEELLRRHGWKFDAETGKVCEVAKRKGAELLPRIIQRLGIEHGKDADAREKIKKELSPYFEDLDAGPRGNIARALENLKR
ncbi:MAG: hypothetical protein ACYDAX_10180 [Desulfobacteria bacterium]